MTDSGLSQKTCTPCRGGIPPLTPRAVADLAPQAPEWQAVEDATKLKRSFKFPSFKSALAFVDRVGAVAEEEFHHPSSINFGWGFATIELQTKKIKGLHENDFILAAKIDDIAEDFARDAAS